jgi:sporulation protein YlmC with PRC-barrel domain
VDDAAAVTDISADPLLEALALKDVAVSESRVLTRSGRTVGTIGDFYLRAETGDIVGIEVLLGDQTASDPDIALIPIGAVHRLGVDLVVLEDDFLERAVADDAFDDPIQTRTDGAPPQAGTGPAAPVESDHPVETTQGSEPAAGSSSPAHAHFLEGKRALRRIEGPSGEVIAEAGELVTIEMIQKAKRADQLLILSLNVE